MGKQLPRGGRSSVGPRPLNQGPNQANMYQHNNSYVGREALRLAIHKLPIKCKIVSRADQEMEGDNSEN